MLDFSCAIILSLMCKTSANNSAHYLDVLYQLGSSWNKTVYQIQRLQSTCTYTIHTARLEPLLPMAVYPIGAPVGGRRQGGGGG